jgi:fructose-1,6-bisphosphatase II / sedoheptulose-1,7-bisphosphatase
MQGRLLFRKQDERDRARKMGISDFDKKYTMGEMAKGDVMFAATGVTQGAMLRGVRRFSQGAETHSMVMRSKSGTVRYISAHHNFARKNWMAS